MTSTARRVRQEASAARLNGRTDRRVVMGGEVVGDEEMVLDGRASLVVGLVSLAVAIYLALP